MLEQRNERPHVEGRASLVRSDSLLLPMGQSHATVPLPQGPGGARLGLHGR